MKNILYIFSILSLTLLSSCYKEYDPTEDLFTVKGDIAQITTFTASPTTVDAGAPINLLIKCHSVNTEMKEIKFYQRVGTTGSYLPTTTVAFTPAFSEAERLHVLNLPYIAPNEKGKTISLQMEIVTSNGLVSNRRTVSPTNITIR
jgi:hypothetical protein